MSRKAFITSHGATCNNWINSWSFINESQKIIIFGAWDVHVKGNKTLILSKDWEKNEKGRTNPAYKQSIQHIRFIESKGYRLMTFAMKYGESRNGKAKIESFTRKLERKFLRREGDNWYAINEPDFTIPEELDSSTTFIEGAAVTISVNNYERNREARNKCIDIHGYDCSVCGFNFEKNYGNIGKEYIHVHHIIPIHTVKREYEIDPEKDLIPVCPNCHAMIHKTNPPLSINKLKYRLRKQG